MSILLSAPVSRYLPSHHPTENHDDQQVTFSLFEAICLLVVPEMLGSTKGAASQMHCTQYVYSADRGLYFTLLPVLFYDGASA